MSDWIIIPTIGENKKCLKPPTRIVFSTGHPFHDGNCLALALEVLRGLKVELKNLTDMGEN
jgi:hypothetical protein